MKDDRHKTCLVLQFVLSDFPVFKFSSHFVNHISVTGCGGLAAGRGFACQDAQGLGILQSKQNLELWEILQKQRFINLCAGGV